MTIAVHRSSFTLPLSLVVLTSAAMLLAGCQSVVPPNANQQGTTGSPSSSRRSRRPRWATSGQKSGHTSRIPSLAQGPADSSASQRRLQSVCEPAGQQPRPAASGTDAHQGVGLRLNRRSSSRTVASKAPLRLREDQATPVSLITGSTQAPGSAPEAQARGQPAPAEKPADKPPRAG